MKKLAVAAAAALCASAVFAEEAELAEETEATQSWRLTVGGFGRGNVRTKLKGATSDHEQLWGADMDLQYNVWQNEDVNIWFGIGGTFCPKQDAYSRDGRSSRTQHDVSDDGYVTYDFNYSSHDSRSVDLGYGEFRLMAVPEWKVTEHLALGARVGVAFDWMRAKCKRRSSWAWNSRFTTDIPGIVQEEDTDSDGGVDRDSDSVTEFAAQAILGLQATYLFTDNIGLYAACDWRLGDKTTFKTDYDDKFDVDLSGWYASAGVVVQF